MTKEERARYRKAHYEDNKEKYRKYSKKWKDNNKEKNQKINKRYVYLRKKDFKYFFDTYKYGAISRNIEFNLNENYFKDNMNKKCSYCGNKINGIGIDRVDNKVGYIKENCVNCCSMCNRMKSIFTKDSFITKCREIALLNKETIL